MSFFSDFFFFFLLFLKTDDGSDVDDDNDDDDNDDLLPVEREALRLKKKQKKLDEEQQEEMQLNIEQREKFQLPGDEEEEEGEGEEGGHKQLHEGSKSPALKEVQMRIQVRKGDVFFCGAILSLLRCEIRLLYLDCFRLLFVAFCCFDFLISIDLLSIFVSISFWFLSIAFGVSFDCFLLLSVASY